MINHHGPSDVDRAGDTVQRDYPWEVQPIAFRVAAGIMFANLLLATVGLLLGQIPNVIAMVIDAALIIGLLQLRSGARGFTLFRAYAGAVLLPILALVQHDPLTAAVTAILQLGYSGSLVLLLQGKTENWKVYTAVGIFVIVAFVPSTLLLLLALLFG